MQLSRWVGSALGVMAIVLTSAVTAESQVVRFSSVKDAVAGRFINPATTAPDPSNPNRLLIGLHTGMDWTTWKARDFRASSGAYSYANAMDSVSLKITAPAGFFISKITYAQRGTGSIARLGFAAGAGNMIVQGAGTNLGTFGTNPTLSRTVDLSTKYLTTVTMSVTINLAAFATSTSGAATLSLSGADVTVQLLPLPLQ